METQALITKRHYYPIQSAIAYAVAFALLMAIWLRTSYIHQQAILSEDVFFGLPRIAVISLLPAFLAIWWKFRIWVLVVGSAALAFAVAVGYVNAVI